jgi:effector-binding domain-containing protein
MRAMAYEVRTEHAAAVPFAAIRATTARSELGATIVGLLDRIWPVLREQEVRTGHNVVVYHAGDARSLDVEVGVQAFSAFADRDGVQRRFTPAGEVATTAHYGDYAAMAPAYAALDAWCASNGRPTTGVSWEVYGDWDDDPSRRRTDIYFQLAPPTAP